VDILKIQINSIVSLVGAEGQNMISRISFGGSPSASDPYSINAPVEFSSAGFGDSASV
jgi:hypothetical protein